MAHKTLIGGTSYNVVGGSTLIDGTAASIVQGNTLVDGTGYIIPFRQEPKILLTKFISFPSGYMVTRNGSTSNDDWDYGQDGRQLITPQDLGLNSFKDIESMYAEVQAFIYGSLLNRYYWKYSTYHDIGYINPYPTDQLETIGWCNEDRSQSKAHDLTSITTGDDLGLKVKRVGSSSSYSRGSYSFWDSIKVDYWGNDSYIEIDGYLVANQIKDFNFSNPVTFVSWSTLEVDKRTPFTQLPYNISRLQVTYTNGNVDQSYWYVPVSSSTDTYKFDSPHTDIAMTAVGVGGYLCFNSSTGFYIKTEMKSSATNFPIKKVRVVYN